MESLEPLVGPVVLVGLALLAFRVLGRDTSVALPRAEPDAPSVQALLRSGRKIDAIKLYRQQEGVGLAEAKDAVEALARGLAE